MKNVYTYLSDVVPPIIQTSVIDGVLTHKYYFPDKESTLDLTKRKKIIIEDLAEKEKKINEIGISLNNKILSIEKNIALLKIQFLKDVYDIEANKLDKNWKIYNLPDYDFYSQVFYGSTSKEIEEISFLPKNNEELYKLIPFSEIEKLLNKLKEHIPNIKISIEDYPNFKISIRGWLCIPKKEFYSLQEIITLFFHELTHYIRGENMYKNLGYKYVFSDNYELEEGLALYNEYLYGNKIIDYGEYYPYYNKVYNILMQDISSEEKLTQMYGILKYKGFSKEKTMNFFQRFYRFAPLGGKKLLLKEAVYYNSYKKVNSLLNIGYNIDKLMSIKGGINSIEMNIGNKEISNFNYKKYFETMVKEIKKII